MFGARHDHDQYLTSAQTERIAERQNHSINRTSFMSVFMVFFSLPLVQPWFSRPELGLRFMSAFVFHEI